MTSKQQPVRAGRGAIYHRAEGGLTGGGNRFRTVQHYPGKNVIVIEDCIYELDTMNGEIVANGPATR